MGFKLAKVEHDSEFEELVRCEFDAFQDPNVALLQIFFPIKDSTPEAREAAIKEATQRQILWHRSDPSSIWLKVTDDETGKVVGGAVWHHYAENPYATIPEGECDWFPAGEDRNAANNLMGQFLTPRMTYMQKPHMFLDISFTHPAWRRKGVGKLWCEWGTKQAEELGLPTYLDASKMGAELYKGCGFQLGPQKELTMAGLPDTPRCKELEKEFLPVEWWPMYRPAPGESGKLPWEQN